MKQYLEIGKVVSTHGLKGDVRVDPWCDSPEFLCGFKTLYFNKGETPVEIERARSQKNMAVIKLKGVDTPEEAQKLRSKVLYMNRNDVKLDPKTYFVQDLIGLEVFDVDTGVKYGLLDEISQTGANDVYHIRNGSVTTLIPAIPDVIIETDVWNGIMKIRPLKGLFENED